MSQRLRPPPLFASPLACYAQCAAVKCASRGAVTYEPRLQRIARCCTSLSPRQNDLKAAKFARGEKIKSNALQNCCGIWSLGELRKQSNKPQNQPPLPQSYVLRLPRWISGVANSFISPFSCCFTPDRCVSEVNLLPARPGSGRRCGSGRRSQQLTPAAARSSLPPPSPPCTIKHCSRWKGSL